MNAASEESTMTLVGIRGCHLPQHTVGPTAAHPDRGTSVLHVRLSLSGHVTSRGGMNSKEGCRKAIRELCKTYKQKAHCGILQKHSLHAFREPQVQTQ